ncbi:MAG: hypothetical protein MI810_15840 [Flavobacteriales bacterium]|nr:hypothetical protein [Flavobacteriales bacterium]
MKLNEFLKNRKTEAAKKLANHKILGIRSSLSIMEVAELHDIVNGMEGLLPTNQNKWFMGYHSMN